MNRIELGNVDGIVNDDTALSMLVTPLVNGEGEFVFLLPEGTSDEVRASFNSFINKLNFGFSTVGRATKIFPTIIKSPPVIVPEPVVIPEPVVVPEPIIEPVVIAEKISAVDTMKRKK